ncbi:hypothetical protein HOY80DRAFT_1019668 [Tuber brumale]|nr:hypothetical protein HOY80DRAFT_1019668 [Tuber brumale]
MCLKLSASSGNLKEETDNLVLRLKRFFPSPYRGTQVVLRVAVEYRNSIYDPYSLDFGRILAIRDSERVNLYTPTASHHRERKARTQLSQKPKTCTENQAFAPQSPRMALPVLTGGPIMPACKYSLPRPEVPENRGGYIFELGLEYPQNLCQAVYFSNPCFRVLAPMAMAGTRTSTSTCSVSSRNLKREEALEPEKALGKDPLNFWRTISVLKDPLWKTAGTNTASVH